MFIRAVSQTVNYFTFLIIKISFRVSILRLRSIQTRTLHFKNFLTTIAKTVKNLLVRFSN